jgi:hypothetical protein
MHRRLEPRSRSDSTLRHHSVTNLSVISDNDNPMTRPSAFIVSAELLSQQIEKSGGLTRPT